MSHAIYHAQSSARRFGGVAEDYLAIHEWFDASKAFIADARHRALRHHAQGIFWCEEVFGRTITNSKGRAIPVRLIGEQHVTEDFRCIPTLTQWLEYLPLEDWMFKNVAVLPKILENDHPLPDLDQLPDQEALQAKAKSIHHELALVNGKLYREILEQFLVAYAAQAHYLETTIHDGRVKVGVYSKEGQLIQSMTDSPAVHLPYPCIFFRTESAAGE